MKIIIPGDPVSQLRARHSTFRGYVTTYDPRAKEKKEIRYHLKDLKGTVSFLHPRLTFLFHFPIPKSIPKKHLPLYQSGTLKHEKKPDADNLVKLYMDCLDGIIFEGDQIVTLGPCLKIYHPEPKTIIWVTETSQILQPWELDVPFLDALEPDIPSFLSQDYPCGSEILWHLILGLSGHNYNPPETNPPLKPPV